MRERLHLNAEEIPEMRRHYFETYGTTLRGLQENFSVNTQEYLAYVHDVPVETVLSPVPELKELLSKITMKKVILTNADINHANRVITALGLQGCFDQIIDINQISPFCKPQFEAYHRALELAGGVNPNHCVFLEDSLRNLAAAKAMGMTTILVGHMNPDPIADFTLSDILALKNLLPYLMNGKVLQ